MKIPTNPNLPQVPEERLMEMINLHLMPSVMKKLNAERAEKQANHPNQPA